MMKSSTKINVATMDRMQPMQFKFWFIDYLRRASKSLDFILSDTRSERWRSTDNGDTKDPHEEFGCCGGHCICDLDYNRWRALTVYTLLQYICWNNVEYWGLPSSSVLAQGIAISCCTKVSTAVVNDPIIGIRTQQKILPCVKAVM